MNTLLILPISFLMDIFFGKFKIDIFLYAKLIFSNMRDFLYDKVYKENRILEFILGSLISIFIMALGFLIPFYLLSLLYRIYFLIGLLAELILFYIILGLRKPLEDSASIYNALQNNGLDMAREILKENTNIDTDDMKEEDIIKKTIEFSTVKISESSLYLSVFFLIGGVPLCFLYRIIQTLSDASSKNNVCIDENGSEKLFGILNIKLCIIVNTILSLFAFLCYTLSSLFLRYSFKNSFAVLKRDFKDSKSVLESSIAAPLDIELGGEYIKDGEPYERPLVGDYMEELNYKHIEKAGKILLIGNIFSMGILILIKLIIMIASTLN